MTEIKAKKRARQLEKEWRAAGKPKPFYVVYDPTAHDGDSRDAYHVANDDALSGYFHGITPIFCTSDD